MEQKIEPIAQREAVRNWQKMERRVSGLSAIVQRYKDGILYIKLQNTEEAMPTNDETAASVVRVYLRKFDSFKDAKAFVVLCYKVVPPNSSVLDKTKSISFSEFERRIHDLDKKRRSCLVHIFSGIIHANLGISTPSFL